MNYSENFLAIWQKGKGIKKSLQDFSLEGLVQLLPSQIISSQLVSMIQCRHRSRQVQVHFEVLTMIFSKLNFTLNQNDT